jgi:hypothetical protein
MSKETLDNIKKDLSNGKSSIKSAGEKAGSVGDSEGKDRCDKVVKEVENLEEFFKGKDDNHGRR